MRRPLTLSLTALALATIGSRAAAQAVSIPNGDPAAVTAALTTHLAAQGFVVDHAGKKDAVFALDRGNVVQQNNRGVVHVHLEVHAWFKRKADTLQVTAAEEAVGAATQGMDFRKPVDSPADVARLQALLETVKQEVSTVDSSAKRDTTH